MSFFGSLVQAVLSSFQGQGGVQAALAQAVLHRFQSNDGGGLAGVLEQLKSKGLGDIVQSWVGTGPNKDITPQQINHGLDADWLRQLAAHAGVPMEMVTQYLSEILPKIVDRLTPDGRLPTADAGPESSIPSLGAAAQRMGGN